MVLTKLLHSIRRGEKLWLTSTVIAILAIILGNSTVFADRPLGSDTPINRISGGIYLYGESERPDVIGKEYIIFEVVGNKTIGAFYLPQSEFSCFYGHFRGSKLNLTLVDAYDRQQYNYNLVLDRRGLTASKQPMMGTPTYQPLGKISANDRRILDACKIEMQGQQ